jgi:hypothetical protein
MVFRVFIPDPTHGEGDWSSATESGPTKGPSAEFRQSLEAEYGEEFQFTSIGTGAAMASYFVELVSDPSRDIAVAVALFLAGKPIKEGLEAWGSMFRKLSKFFRQKPTFDREGAAILVYEAVVERLGSIPKSYQLKGFAIQHRLRYPDPSNLPDPGVVTTIAPAPDRVERAMVYVFQVVADGRNFRVAVDGDSVKFLQE